MLQPQCRPARSGGDPGHPQSERGQLQLEGGALDRLAGGVPAAGSCSGRRCQAPWGGALSRISPILVVMTRSADELRARLVVAGLQRHVEALLELAAPSVRLLPRPVEDASCRSGRPSQGAAPTWRHSAPGRGVLVPRSRSSLSSTWPTPHHLAATGRSCPRQGCSSSSLTPSSGRGGSTRRTKAPGGLSRDEQFAYAEALEDRGAVIHRLLGHPDPVQGDMQLECQLASNGIDCGDAGGYRDPRVPALRPGAADWRLLLQIDSDDAAGMM